MATGSVTPSPSPYTVVVGSGQTIWDIALQCYGDVSGVFLLFADNDIEPDLNYDLATGQVLNIISSPVNSDVVNYYNQIGKMPVTGVIDEDLGGDFNDDLNNDFLI